MHETTTQTSGGYIRACVGSVAGAVAGVAVALAIAFSLEGDPSAGMANLGLIVIAILVALALVVIGAAVGTHVALRVGRDPAPGATAVLVLLILTPIVWNLGSDRRLGLVVALVAAPLGARALALRGRSGLPKDRNLVVGVVVLVWVGAFLPTLTAYMARPTADSVDFQLVEPTYIPGGLERTLVYTADAGTGDAWVKFEYGEPSEMVRLIQSKVTSRYDPPTDCGPSTPTSQDIVPDDLIRPCEHVYTTTAGHEVYRWPTSNTAYLQIDSTIVTVSWGTPEVEKILDSLQPVDPATLD